MTRTMEVFIAGCPLCDEAVQLVRSIACASCDVQVYDLRQDSKGQELAQSYGIKRVPSVVVDDKLAECCQVEGINAAALRALGVGVS